MGFSDVVTLLAFGGIFGAIQALPHAKHSYVIPSEVEGPPKCGKRHPSRRDPSTALRMTTLRMLTYSVNSVHAKRIRSETARLSAGVKTFQLVVQKYRGEKIGCGGGI